MFHGRSGWCRRNDHSLLGQEFSHEAEHLGTRYGEEVSIDETTELLDTEKSVLVRYGLQVRVGETLVYDAIVDRVWIQRGIMVVVCCWWS